MANILGISIGTRNVGLAIIKQRELTDYRIRTFPGKWTDEKREEIWTVVEGIIKRDHIQDISIKLPPSSHLSENLNELARGIEELGKWFGIKVHRCTIQDIKLPYSDNDTCSKKVMVAALIDKYPELQKQWNNSKRAQAYRAKLFEAIACAELALRAGH